ncbi:MAG: ArgR family transcriptional regulator [Prolixibacteraceae bacterium]|nr:ArgR family transcriptional regulator [Prolixibacteraceae bacterium]
MKARLQRHKAIRKILSRNKVKNQEDLLMLLKREGFDLTQATLSRDMKTLQIAKTPAPGGGYAYVLPRNAGMAVGSAPSKEAKYLADGFLTLGFSGNMAVIKTKPAYASSIAAIIDGVNSFEILGTIAGDDTIFVALREGVEKTDLIALLESAMPGLKGKLI